MKKIREIDWQSFICAECGAMLGTMLPQYATWHIGSCEACSATGVSVTQRRDFGSPKELITMNTKKKASAKVKDDAKKKKV